MRQIYEEPALLLRRVDYGDADVIVDLLTAGQGRVSVFARHARRSTRRFAGGLEPFTLLKVRFRSGSEGSLGQLQEADSYEHFEAIIEDPLRLTAAAWLISLVEGLTQPELGGGAFFEHILAILRWLNSSPSPAALACGIVRAEIVLLQDAGVLASLDSCQRSGVALASLEAAIFRPGEGLVDASHASLGDQGVRLSRGSLALLEALLARRVVPELSGASLQPLRAALWATWALVLEREPRTWKAWDQAICSAFPV